MKKTIDSLGDGDSLQVGDLVCWTDMRRKRLELPVNLGSDEYNSGLSGHRMVGVVSQVFCEHVGGRNVALANVFCLKDEKKYEIPVVSLKRIDKNETNYKQEGMNDDICYN